jgi:NAD(P)-dependent dehydrogenase (short-subunit alcohol dehydrogenase family)
MNAIESEADIEGTSSPHASAVAVLVAGVMVASTLVAPAGEAQVSAPRPGQRVALVTGSTSGLGHELALRLGSMGMHVIVHGRNRERGLEVVEAIESDGVGSARFYRADFASFEQVREFGEAILRDCDRLDILINNAGIARTPGGGRTLSQDGYELVFQVNHLSHFLLTRMLLPRLLESVPSRLVNVSSSAQQQIDFDDVMLEDGFSGGRAYAQSKLAQVMFTFDLAEELAEELEGSGVMVNTLHPATYMDTPMVTRGGVTPRATVDEGADAVMQLVTSPDIGSGGYFMGQRRWRANVQAYDEDARTKLWTLSEELTGAR